MLSGVVNDNIINRRYRLLTDTEDLIAISTPDRVRKYVNRAYSVFFNKSESDLVGTSFIDDFPLEKKKFYGEFISQMTPANPTIFTLQKSGNPGNEKWIHWKENGIYDDDGNLAEILTVGRNVDDIINARQQKEEAVTLLKAYREAIDTNVICSITDEKGIIRYANKRFCEVSKYSAEELIGRSHNIINSGFHPREFFVEMWQTILSGTMWQGEIRNKAKDDSIYWVKTVIIPINNPNKQINSFLSLRILITKNKEQEEERSRYLKSLENMLFMVSHELRQPITKCMGLLNILEESKPDDIDEYNEMVRHLMQSANELDNYSRKMNDYLQENKDFSNRIKQ